MLMQPITMITAVPGGGKTLRSIYEGITLAKDGKKVYFLGVDGLNPDLIQELYGVEVFSLPDDWDIKTWRNLESDEGVVLIIDEAHKFFPVRSPGKPDKFIQDLTEIRHFGIQLVLITQDARNVDSFVRRLVGEHLHLTRKAGFNGAMIRTFQSCAENVDDFNARQSSSQEPWPYDKKLFKVYKSASLHVIKPKIPKKVLIGLILLLVCVIGIPFAIFKFKSTVSDFDEAGGESVKTSSSVFNTGSNDKGVGFDDVEAYVKAHTPLAGIHPRSAPIYHDLLRPQQLPEVFCWIGKPDNLGNTCRCRTEQFTAVKDIPEHICHLIVRDGDYNPYKPIKHEESKSVGESVDFPRSQDSNYIPSYIEESLSEAKGLDNS